MLYNVQTNLDRLESQRRLRLGWRKIWELFLEQKETKSGKNQVITPIDRMGI
jgi:hypothetical protein